MHMDTACHETSPLVGWKKNKKEKKAFMAADHVVLYSRLQCEPSPHGAGVFSAGVGLCQAALQGIGVSCGAAARLTVRCSRKELVSPSASVFGPDSGAGAVGVWQSSGAGRGASGIRGEQGGPGSAAAAGVDLGRWGCSPGLLRPLPQQEQPRRVLEEEEQPSKQ